MKKNRSVPKMQNPPPPPPPAYKLRLYHCGSWYLAFGENGKLIETSKITIEENFPDKGQEATIRMPVEIVNEEPGSVTRIETETKCGTSFSFSGYSGDIDKLRAEVCKLREEVETLIRAQPKTEVPKYAVAGGKLFKCENGMWGPVKTEAEEAAEALEKNLEAENEKLSREVCKLREENEKLRIENEMLGKKNELDDRIYCREIKELNAEVKQLRRKMDEMRSVLDDGKEDEL